MTENDRFPRNPVFRDVDLGAEVKRIWGPKWNEPEVSYQFSGKREFKLRTGDDYSRIRLINYASLTGASGDYISTPDSAALDITGDIEFIAYVSADDWTMGAFQAFLAKYVAAGNQESYRFGIGVGGMLRIATTANGSTEVFNDSTVAVPFADGTGGWVKGNLDVDNGASFRVANFYISTDAPSAPIGSVSWSALGPAVSNSGATSIFSGTAPLECGSTDSGTARRFKGKIYSAYVYNGIGGTLVASMMASDGVAGGSSFASRGTGEAWTVNGAASLVSTGQYEVY